MEKEKGIGHRIFYYNESSEVTEFETQDRDNIEMHTYAVFVRHVTHVEVIPWHRILLLELVGE
jgi:hypothetical protein